MKNKLIMYFSSSILVLLLCWWCWITIRLVLIVMSIYNYIMWRRSIVVMDFDYYTGDHGSIPTHGDSLGKGMNLLPGQPMLCEGNWVVSPRY